MKKLKKVVLGAFLATSVVLSGCGKAENTQNTASTKKTEAVKNTAVAFPHIEATNNEAELAKNKAELERAKAEAELAKAKVEAETKIAAAKAAQAELDRIKAEQEIQQHQRLVQGKMQPKIPVLHPINAVQPPLNSLQPPINVVVQPLAQPQPPPKAKNKEQERIDLTPAQHRSQDNVYLKNLPTAKDVQMYRAKMYKIMQEGLLVNALYQYGICLDCKKVHLLHEAPCNSKMVISDEGTTYKFFLIGPDYCKELDKTMCEPDPAMLPPYEPISVYTRLKQQARTYMTSPIIMKPEEIPGVTTGSSRDVITIPTPKPASPTIVKSPVVEKKPTHETPEERKARLSAIHAKVEAMRAGLENKKEP